MAKDPFAVSAEPKVAVPAPEKVTLLNIATAPTLLSVIVGAVPLKTTVPVAGINVPLFDQFPDTVRVLVPVMVKVAPLSIVMLLQAAAPPITG